MRLAFKLLVPTSVWAIVFSMLVCRLAVGAQGGSQRRPAAEGEQRKAQSGPAAAEQKKPNGQPHAAPAAPRNVEEALKEDSEISADHQPLFKVLDAIGRRHAIAIQVDGEFEAPMRSLGQPLVTCELADVSLGEALTQMLSEIGMDYLVRDNMLVITSQAKARALNRWASGSTRTANEVRILSALEEPTEFDFFDQPLVDVIELVEERHQIDIQLDHKSLADAGVEPDASVTRQVKGTTLESALDLVLSDLDLTWVIHDEVLLLTSRAQARRMIETRVYPVYDLVTPLPGELAASAMPDYDDLIDVVLEAAGDDDDATQIRVYRPAGALVISRPITVHRRIEKLLQALRQARTGQTGAQ
jgi:hypothetical protein